MTTPADLLKNLEYRLVGPFRGGRVGAVAADPVDPQVFYFGSTGGGVWETLDGGIYWQNISAGVFVAALGHAHGPNEQRGVFRSRDGGKTWEHVLSRGQDAVASDLSMDPHNPRVLYASFWEARRGPNYLNSGGPGSGLFKTTDSGDTWTDISRNKNLPQGVLGKIGISASAAQRDRVYAIVEAEDGAVFRSADGGA